MRSPLCVDEIGGLENSRFPRPVPNPICLFDRQGEIEQCLAIGDFLDEGLV